MSNTPGEGKASPTVDFDAIAESLRDGSAPISIAYEHAFNVIAFAFQCFEREQLDEISGMDRAEAMAALDRIQDGADFLRCVTPAFDGYPAIAKALKDSRRALFYAQSFMTPFFMLANADVIAAGAPISTYVVRNPDTGLIKIGRTLNVEQRMKALRVGAGATLEVLAVVPGDCEAALHARFAKYRHHGEWFLDASGEIEQFAKRGEYE